MPQFIAIPDDPVTDELDAVDPGIGEEAAPAGDRTCDPVPLSIDVNAVKRSRDGSDDNDEDGENVIKAGISKELADKAAIGRRWGNCEKKLMPAWYRLASAPGNIQFIRMVFFDQFGEVPCCLTIDASRTGTIYKFHDKTSIKAEKAIDVEKTYMAITKAFDVEYNAGPHLYPVTVGLYGNEFTLKGDGFLVNVDSLCMNVLYLPEKYDLPRKLANLIQWDRKPQKAKTVSYIVYDQGFSVKTLVVKSQDTDISLNYNDDLPDDRIRKWVNDNDSGLMILHGEPGTGKTSYIRNLVTTSHKEFMVFDKSLFHHMTDASLVRLLLDQRDSVIVLEDCEDLLTNRQDIGSCMGAILNMTDGILGDSLRFKFICTFNADIVNIDPAILRKGRMRLKYEFKKLKADKAVALGKKLGVEVPHEDMALCDVYNYLQDVGNKTEKQKIGF